MEKSANIMIDGAIFAMTTAYVVTEEEALVQLENQVINQPNEIPNIPSYNEEQNKQFKQVYKNELLKRINGRFA